MERLESQAALLERRLEALDAHGDDARISAAREATLGQLKAMKCEQKARQANMIPAGAALDEIGVLCKDATPFIPNEHGVLNCDIHQQVLSNR